MSSPFKFAAQVSDTEQAIIEDLGLRPPVLAPALARASLEIGNVLRLSHALFTRVPLEAAWAERHVGEALFP